MRFGIASNEWAVTGWACACAVERCAAEEEVGRSEAAGWPVAGAQMDGPAPPARLVEA